MKTRDAGTTITSNDAHVRLRIFDGVIPPDDYHREMHELASGQLANERRERLAERDALEARISELDVLLREIYVTIVLETEVADGSGQKMKERIEQYLGIK